MCFCMRLLNYICVKINQNLKKIRFQNVLDSVLDIIILQ